MPPPTLYTVGHSNHPRERLLELLKQHSIQAVYDVRSQPYSRYNPQFNRETLRPYLETSGMRYVFLGEQLGARSKNRAHYVNGKVQYKAIASTAEFKQGLERVLKGIETERVSLLCAEKDPIHCHRAILVCRQLLNYGVPIRHILENGSLESTADFETRLLRVLRLPDRDLFTTHEAFVEQAYEMQGEKIAYASNPDEAEATYD